MKWLALLYTLFCCNAAFAQAFRGHVVDEAGLAIPLVYVKNAATGAVTTSDSAGYFSIAAQLGDRLVLTHLSYSALYYSIADVGEIRTLTMRSKAVQLGEVKILSEVAKFRRDSALNHTIYRKELGYAASKPKSTVGGGPAGFGVGFDGLFSELALRASGKKKRYKNFAALMEADEQERFIRLRYNVGVVSQVTGLTDSVATVFINAHPMPYDFARTATDLELKSWILEAYRRRRP